VTKQAKWMGADHMIIDVKYANEAKPDKRYGSIVDVSGERYVCPASLVHEFQPGQRYDVEIREDVWSGKDVRIIARILPNGSDGGGAVPARPADDTPEANRLLLLQTLGSEDEREVLMAVRQLLFGLAVAGGNLPHDLERKLTALDAG
jgi:hypothetical protein